MKILLAGNFAWPWHEEACARSLEALGHQVVRFSWQRYLGSGRKAQLRVTLRWAPSASAISDALCTAARQNRPDVLFVVRGWPIRSGALRQTKRDTGAFLVSYQNDDPFGLSGAAFWRFLTRAWVASADARVVAWGLHQRHWAWRSFLGTLPEYDLHFVFREPNVEEFRSAGARAVEILLPYYVPYLHHPVRLTAEQQETLGADVVFVGHAEPDKRIAHVDALFRAGGSVRLYGQYWPRYAARYGWPKTSVHPSVYGEDYCRAIDAAKVALVFYSSTNRDTYTTRCFEIPRIGACMVAQRSERMAAWFREGVEAVYFSEPRELVDKVTILLQHGQARRDIAQRAQSRVRQLRADVRSRMREWVRIVNSHRRAQGLGQR